MRGTAFRLVMSSIGENRILAVVFFLFLSQCVAEERYCSYQEVKLHSGPMPPIAQSVVVENDNDSDNDRRSAGDIEDEDSSLYGNSSSTNNVSNIANLVKQNAQKAQPFMGKIQPDNKTILCDLPAIDTGCFTWWQLTRIDENTTVTTVLTQGCWRITGLGSCSSDVCIPSVKNNAPSYGETLWCCCQGSNCNSNFSHPYIEKDPLLDEMIGQSIMNPDSFGEQNVLVMTICVGVIVIVFVIGGAILFVSSKRRQENDEKRKSGDGVLKDSDLKDEYRCNFDLNALKLDDLISRGRYATVWKGTLDERDVAVKLYSTVSRSNYDKDIYRNMFLNEKDIFNCPFMDHASIVRMLAVDERIAEDSGRMECLIILPFLEQKSLHEYLKTNILDWKMFNNFCQCISRGVSHLHTDIKKGDKYKPAIAHRDLNTRNLLVDANSNVVICDFGFGQKINGSKIIRNGQMETAENSTLADVGRLGTLRYMAPEVLDGAVNLRDCESSLKQIDMYALGLILWEIAMRCSDMFQSIKTPEYTLPFQKEVGLHPTFEEMQMTVSKNKKRPLFPEVWRNNNKAIRALKETIEDCWDQDAEARLTALCVEERVNEMGTLWDKQFGGNCSPTINETGIVHVEPPRHSEYLSTAASDRQSAPTDVSTLDRNGNLPSSPARAGSRRDQSVSVSESTAETYVSSTTPYDLTGRSSSGSSCGMISLGPQRNQLTSGIIAQKNQPLLQPHHGRNLTMERNMLHVKPQRPVTVRGNTLIEGSSSSGDDDSFSPPLQVTSEMFHQLADSLESSLIESAMMTGTNNCIANNQGGNVLQKKQENAVRNTGNHNQRPDSLQIRNPKRPNNSIDPHQAGQSSAIMPIHAHNSKHSKSSWWRKQGKDIYADILGIKKSSPAPHQFNLNQNSQVTADARNSSRNVADLDNTAVKSVREGRGNGEERGESAAEEQMGNPPHPSNVAPINQSSHLQNHHQRSVSDGNSNMLKTVTSPPRCNTSIPTTTANQRQQHNETTSAVKTLMKNPSQMVENDLQKDRPSQRANLNLCRDKNVGVDAMASSTQHKMSNLEVAEAKRCAHLNQEAQRVENDDRLEWDCNDVIVISATHAHAPRRKNGERRGEKDQSMMQPFSTSEEDEDEVSTDCHNSLEDTPKACDKSRLLCDQQQPQPQPQPKQQQLQQQPQRFYHHPEESSCSSDTELSEPGMETERGLGGSVGVLVGRSESCRQASRPTTLSLKGHNFTKFLKHERSRNFVASNPEISATGGGAKKHSSSSKRDVYRMLLPHHHQQQHHHQNQNQPRGLHPSSKRAYLTSLKQLDENNRNLSLIASERDLRRVAAAVDEGGRGKEKGGRRGGGGMTGKADNDSAQNNSASLHDIRTQNTSKQQHNQQELPELTTRSNVETLADMGVSLSRKGSTRSVRGVENCLQERSTASSSSPPPPPPHFLPKKRNNVGLKSVAARMESSKKEQQKNHLGSKESVAAEQGETFSVITCL